MGSTDYFNSAYRDYEGQNPTRKLDHYLEAITQRLSVPAPRLLDLGCGRGPFLERAALRFPEWSLSGIDVDEDALAEASRRVPAADLRTASAEQIPLPDSSFDVITAWDALEHVPDLEKAVSEIQRCLAPGGQVAIVVPVYDGLTGPLVRRLDRDETHLHKESRAFWVDLIQESFDGVEWHGIYRYLLPNGRYIHRPTTWLRGSAPAILMSAMSR